MKNKNASNSKESDKLAFEVYQSLATPMIVLYDRWQDEKEYEDFGQYCEEMKREAEKTPGVEFVSGSSSPFGMSLMIGGVGYRIKMSEGSGYSMLRCK